MYTAQVPVEKFYHFRDGKVVAHRKEGAKASM
jgi:hypothetical protein